MAKERKLYLTVLNVLASFAVVYLHTNVGFWEYEPGLRWIASALIACTFTFAVPVFFMMSGATLMNYRKRYSTRDFFKKRLVKTVIPFVLWSIFSVFFRLALWGRGSITMPPDYAGLFNDLMFTRYMEVFWFFPHLYGAYLSIPIFSAVAEDKRRSVFGYAIIAAVVLNITMPFLFAFSQGKWQLNTAYSVPAMGGYLVYVLIGYWLDNYPIEKKWRRVIYLLGVLGFAMHFFGTWYLMKTGKEANDLFDGYLKVPCLLYSSALFLFFKNRSYEKIPAFVKKCLTFFNAKTFGIYLTHQFVNQVIFTVFDWDFGGVPFRVFGGVTVFLFCAVMVHLVQKVPLLRHVVPQ